MSLGFKSLIIYRTLAIETFDSIVYGNQKKNGYYELRWNQEVICVQFIELLLKLRVEI